MFITQMKWQEASSSLNASLRIWLYILSLSLVFSLAYLIEFLFDVLSVAVFVIRDRFAKKPTRA